LKGVTFSARPASHHIWIPLPERLGEANLPPHLARNGLAVVGEDAFATHQRVPKGIRVSLGAARNRAELSQALQVLQRVLNSPAETRQIV
jgi:DNA-binding transcriptional MocR family regulator